MLLAYKACYNESLLMSRFRSPILFVCALAVCLGGAVPTATPQQTRALWITRTTLTSPDAIRQMVSAAQAGGFNTLLVQVRGRGDAYYNATIEPRASEIDARPSFDPLAVVLDQAHAAGMKVHAWVAVNLIASATTLPASRDHIVYRQPEWLMVPKELAAEMRKVNVRSPAYLGRLARWTRAHSAAVEGLYSSPLVPAAQDHTIAVIAEIAAKYAVDGVHLDYVRFPGEEFDYSPAAVDQFKIALQPLMTEVERKDVAARELLDPSAYPNMFPMRWADFRRERLTALVTRIRSAVKAARPEALVSAAVLPDAQVAFDSRLQDWRGWLDRSLLDVVCPMAYTTESDTFRQQIASTRAYAGSRPVWAGIGAYQLTAEQTIAHVAAAKTLGAEGIILFSYEALTAPPNTAVSVSELGRAAFGSGSE